MNPIKLTSLLNRHLVRPRRTKVQTIIQRRTLTTFWRGLPRAISSNWMMMFKCLSPHQLLLKISKITTMMPQKRNPLNSIKRCLLRRPITRWHQINPSFQFLHLRRISKMWSWLEILIRQQSSIRSQRHVRSLKPLKFSLTWHHHLKNVEIINIRLWREEGLKSLKHLQRQRRVSKYL